MSLRRHVRAAGEQLSLTPREVRSLSAAAYELGRILMTAAPRVDAQIRVLETPALEVRITAGGADPAAIKARIIPAVQPLYALVDLLELDESNGHLVVRLMREFAASAATAPANRHSLLQASAPSEPPAGNGDEAAREAGMLRRAMRELQLELEETNRGVIAMHAELADQEEQLRAAQRDLLRRAEDLEHANRAKEIFLATLSHELRTPLNAMLGWTRLLRTKQLDPAQAARALATIERNAHAQVQLIGDILDISRIVTGKLRIDFRPIELEPVVDAAMDAIRPAAMAKGIRLTCDVHPTGTILGDSERLQQVLWNLLSNAIKFTEPGGMVSVTTVRSNANAVITVADDGIGITADLLPYVFDRFRQGDTSVVRPQGGLGLGLSIARHIVELHGGSIRAVSEGTGRGASFSVSLPATPDQPVD